MDLEDFWRYMGKSEVPIEESGHLSPVTIAKGIEYGVSLLGCFIEGYVGSNQGLGKEADFGKMTRGALEFARGTFATCSGEHNWYEHFELLMRHPVINAGVQIARSPLGIITGCQRISSVHDPLRHWLRPRWQKGKSQPTPETRINTASCVCRKAGPEPTAP